MLMHMHAHTFTSTYEHTHMYTQRKGEERFIVGHRLKGLVHHRGDDTEAQVDQSTVAVLIFMVKARTQRKQEPEAGTAFKDLSPVT